MAERRYLDFDIAIEKQGDEFRARVIQSPTGTAFSTFQRPFVEMELENFVLKMGRKRGVRRKNTPEMDSAKEFGGRLFNTVFSGEVQQCLANSLKQARQQDLGLRIRLSMKDAQELTDLPWEYLYDSNENHFLALSNETPLVRFIDMPQFIAPLAVRPPIRMLVMISSPTDSAPLDVAQEKAKLDGALRKLEDRGLVTVDILEPATLGSLQQRLRENEYHIFHFIGHGGFDKQNDEGILIFEEDDKTGREVGAQILAPLLRDERTLRLAVLNACEGARTSSCDPFSGTAQTLVQQGIPAVIAMQFDVSDQAAIAFTQEFYKAIAIGYPVDAALAEGRKAIFAQVNEVEWGTPVLYTRARDGNVFDVTEVNQDYRKGAEITALMREAEQELASENWSKGVEKLRAALALDESNSQVRARLSQAEQQQELARLYAKGRTAYDAGSFKEALDFFHQVQIIKRDYRGIEPLIKTIEKELALSREEELKRQHLGAILQECEQAKTTGNWPLVMQKAEAALKVDPANADAANRFAAARQQIEISNLYNRGVNNLDNGRIREGLSDLTRVRDLGGNYRDLARQIAYAEQQLAAPTIVTPVPEKRPFFSSMKLISVGGCLGVLAVIVVVVLLLLVYAGNFTQPSPETTTQPTSNPPAEQTAAPETKYSSTCSTSAGQCQLPQSVPVGTACQCVNFDNGLTYTGVAQ